MYCRSFRGSRYFMQGEVIASYSIPRDAITYPRPRYRLLGPKTLYDFIRLSFSFKKNRHIFPQEPGGRAGKSLALILSYRHGNTHFIVRTISRPFRLYYGNIHTCKAGLYIGTSPTEGTHAGNVKTGMRTSINFIMGIHILLKQIHFVGTVADDCHFIAIRLFEFELPTGNGQIGDKPSVFHTMWPWNLTDDLEKQ